MGDSGPISIEGTGRLGVYSPKADVFTHSREHNLFSLLCLKISLKV